MQRRPAGASAASTKEGRDGFVLGEGAWMVVLEREDRARARAPNLRVGGRVWSTCDAYYRVRWNRREGDHTRDRASPSKRSGRHPDHRLRGLPRHLDSANDAVESHCVARVFGDHAGRIVGSSVKSMIGHPAGASGRSASSPPRASAGRTICCCRPSTTRTPTRPAALDSHSQRRARERASKWRLCNCLGFGSKNSAIVRSGEFNDAEVSVEGGM